jgi:hypothetical protein
MKVDTNNLQTIKNYATERMVTPSYIYKLIKENKMQAVVIDGVQFIDTVEYSKLPTKG